MTAPSDEELLAFEGQHLQHTTRKEADIRAVLGIAPARYYQLLRRLIQTENALRIDPILTNRLRDRAARRRR